MRETNDNFIGDYRSIYITKQMPIPTARETDVE